MHNTLRLWHHTDIISRKDPLPTTLPHKYIFEIKVIEQTSIIKLHVNKHAKQVFPFKIINVIINISFRKQLKQLIPLNSINMAQDLHVRGLQNAYKVIITKLPISI